MLIGRECGQSLSRALPKGTYTMSKVKMHPNSLRNLTGAWDSESAKEAQLLGAAKKKANRLAREQLKLSLNSWKELREELSDDFSSVELLRVLAMQKLEEGDVDAGVEILKSIAEFEQPKLQRIDQKIEEVDASELSDEELEAALKQISEE